MRIATLFILTLVFGGWTSPPKESMVDWNQKRPLRWSDFKAKAPAATKHAALSHTGIDLALSYESGEFHIEIVAQFDQAKSWKIEKAESDHLLKHEQVHFDITELYARKLREKILTTRWKSSGQVTEELTGIYQANAAALSSSQKLYDRETEHSLVKEEQARWNSSMEDSLKAYSKYAGQEIHLKLR